MGLGLLAASLTTSIAVPPAKAQFLRSWSWHPDEGPPPIPPGYIGHPRRSHPPEASYETVSFEELHRSASRLGLRIVAKPRRKGHVFIVFAKDLRGVLHHLAFDARAGTLIENAVTGITLNGRTNAPLRQGEGAAAMTATPKAAVARAATPTPQPSAATFKVVSKPSAVQAATPLKPAAPTPSALADKELSPIKPQPGRTAPSASAGDIDKD